MSFEYCFCDLHCTPPPQPVIVREPPHESERPRPEGEHTAGSPAWPLLLPGQQVEVGWHHAQPTLEPPAQTRPLPQPGTRKPTARPPSQRRPSAHWLQPLPRSGSNVLGVSRGLPALFGARHLLIGQRRSRPVSRRPPRPIGLSAVWSAALLAWWRSCSLGRCVAAILCVATAAPLLLHGVCSYWSTETPEGDRCREWPGDFLSRDSPRSEPPRGVGGSRGGGAPRLGFAGC